MKLNRFKIIITLIVIILLIVVIPIIRKRIMYNEVKSKFLANVYEINRNGNFHIVEKVKHKYEGGLDDYYNEQFAKDGEGYQITRFNYQGENYNTITYTNLTEMVHMSENADGIYGGIIPNYITQMFNLKANLATEVFTNCKFNKIEKGTYKGKECYVIEVTWEKDEYAYEKYVLYISPETYLPYGTEYYSINDQYTEAEYEAIEIGTVKEVPMKYDVDFLKSKSQKQLIGNVN